MRLTQIVSIYGNNTAVGSYKCINIERIVAARSSSAELNSLISFKANADEAYIDFDWSPAYLEQALVLLGNDEMAMAVTEAFEGSELLTQEHPDGTSQYDVYTDIRVHNPEVVSMLANKLSSLPLTDMAAVGSLVTKRNPRLATLADPVKYILEYGLELVSFYSAAAKHHQAVISWWD